MFTICQSHFNTNCKGNSMNAIRCLLALFVSFFFALPAHAEQWEDPKAGAFRLGYADQYVSGAVTIETVAPAIVANFSACEEKYGKGGCYIQFHGTTDVNRYDNKPNGKDQGLEGGLGNARANALKVAVFGISPGMAESTVDDVIWNNRKDGYRYAWATIKPRANATVMPTDPNKKWGFLNEVLLREADNLCPTFIVADARTQTYSVQFNDCACSNWDVVPETTEVEVYSDVAIAQIARTNDKKQIAKDLEFTDIRIALQEGTSSRVVEVNERGEAQMTPDGLSVEFIETATTMSVRFPDRCSPMIEAQRIAAAEKAKTDRLAKYNTDAFVGGSIDLTAVHLPLGSPFNTGTGMDTSAHVVGGLVLGNGHVAWTFGGQLGAAWDTSCLQPAGFDLGAFTGPWINRQGRIGFTAYAHGSWMSSPYNGQWLTTRSRFGVDLGLPVQLGNEPLESKWYVAPSIGIGLDLVYGESSPDFYVLTERRVGPKVGLAVVRTF